jgi:hypothetical protein
MDKLTIVRALIFVIGTVLGIWLIVASKIDRKGQPGVEVNYAMFVAGVVVCVLSIGLVMFATALLGSAFGALIV